MAGIRILLTLVFAWLLFKSGSLLMRDDSMDLVLLERAGLGWCFWILLPATGICLLLALTYLWWPGMVLYRLAQAAVLLHVVEMSVTTFAAINHPEAAKEAFITSRTARGLPVREEVLQLMERPSAHLLPLAVAVGLNALWLFLLYLLERRRSTAGQPTHARGP